MNKYLAVICYDKNGQPSFEHTTVFTADNIDDAYQLGGDLIHEMYPTEEETGYNWYVINLDEVLK